MTEQVSHPLHYTAGGIEAIDIIRAKLTPAQFKGYLFGNVLKYTLRWPYKDGLRDLNKAAVYLGWLRECVKGSTTEREK